MLLKLTHLFYIALLILLFSPPIGHTVELNGQISSDLYAYQGKDQDHLRPYLRFRANMLAWRGSNNRALRLVTSLRWTSDLADQLPSDPSLFVYQTYARLQGLPGRSDVRIGRQFVYSGVGSALMDGGRISLRPWRYLDVNLFGGSTVSSEDPETIRSLGDYLIVGGRLGLRPYQQTQLGLSWLLKQSGGSVAFNRVGLDVNQPAGRSDLYGRVSFNAVKFSLADVMARVSFRPGPWYVSGEYQYREPVVFGNSIFAVIDADPYQIGRVEARRRIWQPVSIVGSLQADLSSDENSWRTGLGFNSPTLSLSWIYQTGFGGDNNGLSGYFNRPLSSRLTCYASARLYRYRVQQEQVERSDAYASTAGLRYRAGWGVTVITEGQYLRNAVYANDSRILIRIIKHFSTGFNNSRKES
jgi:hypothetical protein